MKRLITFLLALVMLLSLAACAENTPTGDDKEETKGEAPVVPTTTQDNLPEGFEVLHDYIVKNGAQDEAGHTVVFYEFEDGEKYTMSATADGKIFWNHFTLEGVKDMTMELMPGAKFQTITVIHNEYTCTATIETATVTYSEFALSSLTVDPEPDFGTSMMEALVELKVSMMLMLADSYLPGAAGVSMASLGFTNFKL